jgi:TolB-like protein/thioredoxin-like negative regulator of GroEL
MTEKPGKNFFAQFKERKILRVGIVYIVVGWLVIQVGEVTFEALILPPWALALLIVFVLLGFPLALVLAWAFEATPKGIRRDSAGLAAEPEETPPELDQSAPSIAVLPFDDMSKHGDQGYFCEGIAEEILNALCKVSNLRVASRVTAFRFSGRTADVKEIGSKLKVQTVLEGSVRKSGDKLRITAQLVKTADGYHLWSRQYDRGLEDIFEIQAEIADSIANALSVTLKRASVSAQKPADPRAYDFFLRGQSYFARQNIQDTAYARQMFNRALEVDPEYGRAWAGLAYTYGFEQLYLNAADSNREEALRTSKKALELAPDLAESQVSAGIAYCMVKDYAQAEIAFEKAIELDPKNYDAWYFYGRNKVHEGEIERALKLFERASKVRPEDYQSVLLQPQLYHSLGDHEHELEAARKGIERARAVLELNPDDNRALNMGAFALVRLGELDEAEKWMQASLEKAPMDSIVHYNAACLYALAGNVEKSLDCLEDCQFKVGNLNREWLEHDSDLDSIRYHPRFAEIIAAFPD